MIQGSMVVLIDGKRTKLSNGEGKRFNANQFHGYRNLCLK
ncbi:hypothetical protein [Legionella genomosp. 1]